MTTNRKNFHVVPTENGWAVREAGREGDGIHTRTQQEAIERARELALEHKGDVLIYSTDGSLRAQIRLANDRPIEDFYLYKDRIVVSPTVLHGKPRINGTRILVETVLDLLSAGISIDTVISKHFPDLTPQDVFACLGYATNLVREEKYASVQHEELSARRSALPTLHP